MKNYLLPLILLFTTQAYSISYNVIDFGAVSDTNYLSTKAIQIAIDQCSKKGGGDIVVPAGSYKIGTIILKSNTNLYLEPGATLYGSTNLDDYLNLKPNFISLRTQEATKQLIYSENATNVSISGYGEINGRGKIFKKMSWNDEGITRPHLIRFIECSNINVSGITLKNSACWMQHYLACDKVQIHGLKIFNRNNFNNDALDLDGCTNVTVSDIISDSDDDGITLKSTSNRMCENIVISNCVISSRCNAIKMGTESNGGFRNISVSNIVVQPSDYKETAFYGSIHGTSGITLEIVDGGKMENITISNINIEETESPIFLRLANRARPYKKGMEINQIGTIEGVSISNIYIKNAQNIGCSITGMPDHPIKNVTLKNIVYQHHGNGSLEDANNAPEELPKTYPEATMFGTLPSQGFFIRHAENIDIDGLKIITDSIDIRPLIQCDDVSNTHFCNIQKSNKEKLTTAFRFNNSKSITITQSFISGISDSFITIEDEKSDHLIILNNVINGFKNLIDTKNMSLKSKVSGNIMY